MDSAVKDTCSMDKDGAAEPAQAAGISTDQQNVITSGSDVAQEK